jgi:hypothetical protein
MVHVALRFGERPEVAYGLPGSVDGMLVVASIVMVDDKRRSGRVRPTARLAFTAGVTASIAANIAAAQPSLGARIVDAWPALALLLVVEMLLRPPAPAAEVPPGTAAEPPPVLAAGSSASPMSAIRLPVEPRMPAEPVISAELRTSVVTHRSAPFAAVQTDDQPASPVPTSSATNAPATGGVARAYPVDRPAARQAVAARPPRLTPPAQPLGLVAPGLADVPVAVEVPPVPSFTLVPPSVEVPPAAVVPPPVVVPPPAVGVPPAAVSAEPPPSRREGRPSAGVGNGSGRRVDRPARPAAAAVRRPAATTRQLARQILDAEPHLSRAEVAARLGVSTRRLREVLAATA